MFKIYRVSDLSSIDVILFSLKQVFIVTLHKINYMIGEFLQEHHLLGLLLGLCTFLVIGIFHPLVIKAEYYFGVKCWWWFLLGGLLLCACAYLIDDIFLSVLSGVAGFSSFWSILEVYQQRERVRKGWFPDNPKRAIKEQRKCEKKLN